MKTLRKTSKTAKKKEPFITPPPCTKWVGKKVGRGGFFDPLHHPPENNIPHELSQKKKTKKTFYHPYHLYPGSYIRPI